MSKFTRWLSSLTKVRCKGCGSKKWGAAVYEGSGSQPFTCDQCLSDKESKESWEGIRSSMDAMDKMAGKPKDK